MGLHAQLYSASCKGNVYGHFIFISRKKYLISNFIIYFRFPRACMRNYTMHALLYMSIYMKSPCLTLEYKYSTSHTNI